MPQSLLILSGFSENRAKGNTDQCHYQKQSSEVHIGKSIIKSSDCEKLIDIKIDSKLHF